MGPVGTSHAAPNSPLKDAIEQEWGSIQSFRAKFDEAATGVFGSGWAWLSVNPVTGKLFISSTPNQGT